MNPMMNNMKSIADPMMTNPNGMMNQLNMNQSMMDQLNMNQSMVNQSNTMQNMMNQ